VIRIVGGKHRGRILRTVPGTGTRPTSGLVRKALFDIARGIEGQRVLDLFAGTGAVALEALSRGACDAVAIEQGRQALDVIGANARTLHEPLTIVRGDVLAALAEPNPSWAAGGPFAMIYADPPYAFEAWEPLVASAARFLAPGGLLAVEHPDSVSIAGGAAVSSPRDYRYGGSVISVFKPAIAG